MSLLVLHKCPPPPDPPDPQLKYKWVCETCQTEWIWSPPFTQDKPVYRYRWWDWAEWYPILVTTEPVRIAGKWTSNGRRTAWVEVKEVSD